MSSLMLEFDNTQGMSSVCGVLCREGRSADIEFEMPGDFEAANRSL